MALALTLAGCGGQSGTKDCDSKERLKLILATGPQGGAWYPLGGAMADVIQEHVPGSQVTVTPGGGITNVIMVGENQAQLAFGFPSDVLAATKGEDDFAGKIITNIRAIAALYPGVWHMAAPVDGAVKSVADLKGKRLAVPPRGNTAEVMTRRIMAAYGLTYDDLANVSYVNFSDAADLFRDGHVDAVVGMSTVPFPALNDLATSKGINLISIDEDVMGPFIEQNPDFMPVTIPAGSYAGENDDVLTFGTMTLIITNAELSEEAGYAITKAFFEGKDKLVAVTKTMEQMTVEESWKTLGVPLHPGAERYFREAGGLK